MISVRKAAKTTAALIFLIMGITALMHWCGTRSEGFLYQANLLLNSKNQIGVFHSFAVSRAFWLLIVSSGVEAVFKEKSGIYIIGSFGVPIIFSLCVATWGIAATFVRVNITCFWLFCYASLIIFVRVAYGRLSNIKGAGPSQITLFVKNVPSKNDSDVSIIDRSVLYVAKAVMLVGWFAVLISSVVFCVQYKQIFGL